jgi:hypothetical protein
LTPGEGHPRPQFLHCIVGLVGSFLYGFAALDAGDEDFTPESAFSNADPAVITVVGSHGTILLEVSTIVKH